MEKQLFVTTGVTQVSTTDREGKGTIRWVDEKMYQWVYNAGAVAARANSPACYDVSANGTSADFVKECVPDCADADIAFFAGIWMAAVAAGSYGWILVLGRSADAKIAVASGVDGSIGDQYVPSTYTATTGTGAARAFALIQGLDASLVNSAATVADLVAVGYKFAPHCVALEAPTTAGSPVTDTAPLTYDVFVRGLMAH